MAKYSYFVEGERRALSQRKPPLRALGGKYAAKTETGAESPKTQTRPPPYWDVQEGTLASTFLPRGMDTKLPPGLPKFPK